MKREGRFGPLFLIVILFSHTHSTKPLFVKSGSGFFRLLAKVGGYGMKMQTVKMEWRF